MKAYEVRDTFGVDALTVSERPDPKPGPGQVVVNTRAVSLNFRDLLVIKGDYNRKLPLPMTPCSDCSGEVAAVGDGVTRVKVGDRVRTKNIHPSTHTRLPRYARGHEGVVERLHGAHVFPDSAAVGKGDDPQWLYTVRFDAQELWGADAEPKLKVSIEAFEPYLEHV